MSKKLWIGLLFALVVCWIGLKPHLSGTAPEKQTDIAQLTDAKRVARWLQQHHRLPDFYLTKSAARRQGWNPAQGNLCEVLPGRVIGGDRFSNRERRLPMQAGRQWYEADVNYDCGHRDADRLLYSSDGLIFLTTDHYRSFTPVP
ncbi:ribonuclease domain-containing protein [Pantoea sp. WEP]|uniref:ribonuclease domain-containing protein n=1 Tax=Pantoea sp. WEP TaxID=3230025 RepID=UPI0035661356